MSTEGSGASSASRAAPSNEDAYLVHDGLGLYVVCDGASEGPAGDIAAATAVESLQEFVAAGQKSHGGSFLRTFVSEGWAIQAVRTAMAAVIKAAQEDDRLEGMVTTVSMLLAHRHRGTVCHVGDSRVYLVRHGHVHLLTADHELSIGAETAVAYEEAVVECFSIDLHPGDTFLLCTDGAQDVVEDPDVLGPVTGTAPYALAGRIVEAARLRNPDRDATAVVVRVRGEEEQGWLWLSVEAGSFKYGHGVGTA